MGKSIRPTGNHLESECLLLEVGGDSKIDGQVDPPDGLCSFSRHDSMEAPDAGSKVGPLDPQKVEGLGIDDVEAAAPVHEYFSEARVGDDGINDERVDSRIGDVVRMVITVKSDGHVGPVKEEWGCPSVRRKPLDALACAGVLRDASRVPVYHEAVMDLRKPLVLVITLFLGSSLSSFLMPKLSKYLRSM
jgi:hypothetical protein